MTTPTKTRARSIPSLRDAQHNIARHLQSMGPTNYQVDDVVLCKVSGQGLEAGKVYPVYSVLRRRAIGGIETTVTVNADERLVQICPAEPVLRRTRIEVSVTALDSGEPDQTLTFADAIELEAWRKQHGVAADRLHEFRYVEMQ